MVTKFLNISTDPKLSSNSNILVPSEKAVRSFIASKSIQLDYLQSTTPEIYDVGQKWLNISDKKIYTAVSSSDWGTGESIEIDQFFTFKDLLYYYDGTNINAYSTLTIIEQNQERKLKTWLGTREDYLALNGVYDPNTIYQVIETSSESDKVILATQNEYNEGSSLKAATPYQVKQDLGNYLSLVNGGNLAASKTIGLTNSNNEVAYLGYNTSAEITVSQGLNVTNTLNANNIVARSGNIYKTNTSGATAVWSDSYATTSKAGVVKIDGDTIVITNGIISTSGIYIVETSPKNLLPSWYRIWSDGWVEQGGHVSSIAGDSGTSVNFLIKMADTNYSVFGGAVDGNTTAGDSRFKCYDRTQNGMTIDWTSGTHVDGTWWEVKGYKYIEV